MENKRAIKKNVLYRILCLTTNSEVSRREAASFFDCKPDAEAELRETLSVLPIDQSTTIERFMTDDTFAKSIIRCAGFIASGKADFYCMKRNDFLIEQYNNLAGRYMEVDMYRMLSFIDVVGDDLLLSENSPTIVLPSTWLTFLTTYSLAVNCNVWAGEKSLVRTLFEEVPSNISVPMYMLCWILNPERLNEIVRDLQKCRSKKHKDRARALLLQLLTYDAGLEDANIKKALRYMNGLNEEEFGMLISGKNAVAVKSFLKEERGIERL